MQLPLLRQLIHDPPPPSDADIISGGPLAVVWLARSWMASVRSFSVLPPSFSISVFAAFPFSGRPFALPSRPLQMKSAEIATFPLRLCGRQTFFSRGRGQCSGGCKFLVLDTFSPGNATIRECNEKCIVFMPKCGGITRGKQPRGAVHKVFSASWSRHTRSKKYALRGRVSELSLLITGITITNTLCTHP